MRILVAMYMYGVKKDRNYPEQRLKLILFLVCLYVYMYASNFATLSFILLHEYINPMN